MLRIINGFAEHESAVKSERVARKSRQRAESGEWRPDGSKVFGYLADGTPDPIEAPKYREAVDRVLAGESVTAIVADWQHRGIMTAAGRKWTASNLRRTLQVPRHAGLVAYHGEVLGPGEWEPLIAENRWRQLQAVLERRAPKQRRRVTQHLLTGLARCAVCGTGLQGVTKRKSAASDRWFVEYRCTSCRACAIRGEKLEPFIVEKVLAAIDSPDLWTQDDSDCEAAVQEIAELSKQLEQLAYDYYSEKLIDRTTFLAIKTDLEHRIEELRRRLTRSRRRDVITDHAPLIEHWEGWGIAFQRSVLDLVIERIDVSKGYDAPAQRAKIFWKR
jgi:hypothetical protein